MFCDQKKAAGFEIEMVDVDSKAVRHTGDGRRHPRLENESDATSQKPPRGSGVGSGRLARSNEARATTQAECGGENHRGTGDTLPWRL